MFILVRQVSVGLVQSMRIVYSTREDCPLESTVRQDQSGKDDRGNDVRRALAISSPAVK